MAEIFRYVQSSQDVLEVCIFQITLAPLQLSCVEDILKHYVNVNESPEEKLGERPRYRK
jgi:hypothetical protein